MVTKPGKYGTLKLYELTFSCTCDPYSPCNGTSKMWAYSVEHAEEKFVDAHEDDGWQVDEIRLAR